MTNPPPLPFNLPIENRIYVIVYSWVFYVRYLQIAEGWLYCMFYLTLVPCTWWVVY